MATENSDTQSRQAAIAKSARRIRQHSGSCPAVKNAPQKNDLLDRLRRSGFPRRDFAKVLDQTTSLPAAEQVGWLDEVVGLFEGGTCADSADW